MQIVKFFKSQVRIISLGALYCKSIVKMKSPMDLTDEINLKKQQDV